MEFTISSVLTTCFLDSFLILLLCPIFKRNSIIQKVGPKWIVALMLSLVIRMLIPFEFGHTYSIYITNVLPAIRSVLNFTLIQGTVKVTVWQMLIIVWLLGIILRFGKEFIFYRHLVRSLRVAPKINWDDIFERTNLDNNAYPYVNKIQITSIKKISSPCLIGFKHPFILLPDRNYEDEELTFILQHELIHYRRKDIIWKSIADILCGIFWWNPLFTYLKKQIFQIIEIGNDMEITAVMTDIEKIDYMECLKNLVSNVGAKDVAFGVSFCKTDFIRLKQRLKIIGDGLQISKRSSLAVTALVTCFLILSTSIIFEPHSLPDEGTPLTPENTYLIQQGDIYDVYVYDKFLFSTDYLFPFKGVEIFQSKEEANNYE